MSLLASNVLVQFHLLRIGRDRLSVRNGTATVWFLGDVSAEWISAVRRLLSKLGVDDMLVACCRPGANHPHPVGRTIRDLCERLIWSDLDASRSADVGGNSHRHAKAGLFPHCLEPSTCPLKRAYFENLHTLRHTGSNPSIGGSLGILRAHL